MKIISLFSTTVGLHSLVLEHPVVHIIDYPMAPPTLPCHRRASPRIGSEGPVEQLISLSVSHIEVQRGELLWEDKKVPFDFAARDLALLLNYSLLRRQYEAHVAREASARALQDYPSFAWRAERCAGSGPRTCRYQQFDGNFRKI
jgi:hypothetical protein